MAQLVLSEEERVVDQELGYPRCYGKLCSRAFAGADLGFFTPFTAGPPQRFVPYSPPAEDVSSLSVSLTETPITLRCKFLVGECFSLINKLERLWGGAASEAEGVGHRVPSCGRGGEGGIQCAQVR